MGRRDEYRKSDCFARIEKILRDLTYFAKNDEFRINMVPHKRLYRILPNPITELDLWEERGGFEPEKSSWRRFPCTANRYLGCMIKMELRPPGLTRPQVMIEIHDPWPDCVEYSKVAVENVPTIGGLRAGDVYVDQEDLALLECWLETKIDITEIKNIYLAGDADDDVKKRVKEFAGKHSIPLVNGIPCPSDDEKVMEDVYRPSNWGVTDESLKELVKFLKERGRTCYDRLERAPADSVAAALTETMDEAYHGLTPLGASDAVYVRNERSRVKEHIFERPPPPECDAVICKAMEALAKALRP